MSDIIEITKFPDFSDFEPEVDKAIGNGMNRIAKIAQRASINNALISPNQQVLDKGRKSRVKRKRNPRATSRPAPGGLERSIERQVTGTEAIVFVAANSFAGKYAKKMHDGKGSSWKKPGPGSQAKGSRADEKFISRAIVENEGNFTNILEDELGKVD